MTRRLPPVLLALALAGCDEQAPTPDPAATSATASAPAAAASAPAASASTAPALKAAGAKAYAKTAEQDLGTLPEGVGIAVGEKAPDFELPSVEGAKVKLSELTKSSWVLLTFYRGGW